MSIHIVCSSKFFFDLLHLTENSLLTHYFDTFLFLLFIETSNEQQTDTREFCLISTFKISMFHRCMIGLEANKKTNIQLYLYLFRTHFSLSLGIKIRKKRLVYVRQHSYFIGILVTQDCLSCNYLVRLRIRVTSIYLSEIPCKLIYYHNVITKRFHIISNRLMFLQLFRFFL